MKHRTVVVISFAVMAMVGSCHTDSALPSPAPVASPSAPSQPSPTAAQSCGSRTCAAGELCEDLYKGHGLDAEGRPLGHLQCVPLPDACRSTPTCACVTQQLAATHCDDDGGHVRIDDYPNR